MLPREKYNYRVKYKARLRPCLGPIQDMFDRQRQMQKVSPKILVKQQTEKSAARYRLCLRLRQFRKIQRRNPCRLETVGTRGIGIMRMIL